MGNNREALLAHLRKGEGLFDFPGIIKVKSLDEIQGGMDLLEIPDSLDNPPVYLLERIQIKSRNEKGLLFPCICLDMRGAYQLVYSIAEKGLTFCPTNGRSRFVIGAKHIDNGEYYRFGN